MKTCIHWFRKGLRLHDNPALLEASNSNIYKQTYPIYILDDFVLKAKNSQNRTRYGVNRVSFLLECLMDLDQNLRRVGSKLYVFKGVPAEIIPKLVKFTNANTLTFESDTEAYSIARDQEILQLLSCYDCEVKQFNSHTLIDPNLILNKPKSDVDKKTWPRGKPLLTYNSFLLKSGLSDINNAKLLPIVEKINNIPSQGKDLCSLLDDTFIKFKASDDYTTPTMEGLGLKCKKTTNFKGGETIALKILDSYIKDKEIVKFEKPKTAPTAIKPNYSTTRLSPYLAFGCLSCRLFHQKLVEIESQTKNYTRPPVSLRGQLYWREFFYTCAYATPNFDKMAGNPVCLQIDWDCKKEGDSNKYLEAWTNAKTGFPWIDAIMTQLREEGWIHHLARHSVACFLTRGDMYVSWERGLEVFEELLVDADWSINTANWLWLSASAFFNQYFRVYSPITFPKKTDKNGNYIRHFLPILKNYPKQYIYEPWKCPVEQQKKYGCIIGKDYPKPILDHEECKAKNIDKIKRSYKEHLLGNVEQKEPSKRIKRE